MLHRSTIQLLRFPFSYFLMPVFWFTVSFVYDINWQRTLFAFLLIHILLYPSSNGYNSFMDRDTKSIGGLEKPMQPTKQLFYTTVIMDVAGLLLSFFISWQFAAGFAFYILCSRMYSYRGIRLKRFAIAGYLIVILNQGALIFAMVYHAASKNLSISIPLPGMIAAAFLIGGFYPITQIYQHKADAEDDVKTISMIMGKKGTFIFCTVMYAIAFSILFLYYKEENRLINFLILQIFFIAVIIYFIKWMLQVWKNESMADFKHTMLMNMLASTCTNFAFITLILLQQIG
ncbi:MAG TPA: UbiA family prenyltransferase [Chitinophagaceae bacterium]|nr:UbiA family prenyltransferase [Chitinophagaceae bacterium]